MSEPFPAHPVDAMIAFAKIDGFYLDPEMLAEARRICDEPVPVDEPPLPKRWTTKSAFE